MLCQTGSSKRRQLRLHLLSQPYSNNHLQQAIYPNANVSPVFKKGSKHEAVNYRPVSLTCVLCKLLEHIICKHILDHLESYNILTSFQHGFRSGHSCESQLIITLHDLMSNYDRKVQTVRYRPTWPYWTSVRRLTLCHTNAYYINSITTA